MQVMECVSTWPLLQRNKIEDSKINVAVQAIADVTVPEDEMAVTDEAVEPEDSPKLQEVNTELSEPTNLEPAETNVDQSQSVIKSENAEPADVPTSTHAANDVTPMTVDEPNLECRNSRTTERHESQVMKLKRLATKVVVSRSGKS